LLFTLRYMTNLYHYSSLLVISIAIYSVSLKVSQQPHGWRSIGEVNVASWATVVALVKS